jgi:hypothetical protein
MSPWDCGALSPASASVRSASQPGAGDLVQWLRQLSDGVATSRGDPRMLRSDPAGPRPRRGQGRAPSSRSCFEKKARYSTWAPVKFGYREILLTPECPEAS